MEQRAMVMSGFIQFPVDLANFGMDYGLRLWYKCMQEFHDEIKEENDLVEKYKLEFRGLQGIPADIIPSDLADQAGNADDNKVIREVVEYIGLSDHRVIQLYESFKNLCKADVNPKEEWYLTVDELFHLLGLRFGKKEYGDFVHIMWDVARLDPDERIYFKDFVKLCGIWCIMGREQILLCVFNSQDPMNDGNVPFERLRDLMWELHKESLQYRRRKVRGILDNMGVEEFIKDGSGKWSFKAFTKMHFKYPQLLYPLFFFQWGLCEKTISLNFWESQRAHLHKHREDVTKEVQEHEEAVAALRIRETQAALTRATLKDTVKAILTNGPMPEGATEETVKLATKRVRKLKKKAKRLHVDINVLVEKMK
jgi:Ca2+-binding EF-hand superfamily protein